MELHIKYLIPEMILLATACVITLLGLSGSDKVRRSSQWLAALACIAGLGVTIGLNIYYANSGAPLPTSVAYVNSRFFNADFITGLACVVGLLCILTGWDMPSRSDPAVPDKHYRGEFYAMLLFSLSGVAMIGKVNDLVWLFIALELVSIPTYILVATGRSQLVAQEAGIKYFFLGALAAAIFLFGFSYIYGATGATRFAEIRTAFGYTSAHPELTAINSPLALIGILAVILGVSYKIAAVPMHFYTPDVYQGAATPVTAYLAFAPKAAGMIAIIDMLSLFNFNYTSHYGMVVMQLLAVMAVLTMTVGNVLALLQRNVKRMMAYSSIAHSGYMLVGLVAGPGLFEVGTDGVQATLFYLASYAIMNTGAFAVLVYLQGKADTGEDLDDLAGVGREHRGSAFMMLMALLSLMGMPLTLGFWAKLFIVNAALYSSHWFLAVVVAVNAAIAAAYYLKVVATMYLREPLYPFVMRSPVAIRVAAVACTVGVVVLFFVPSVLMIPSWGYQAHEPPEMEHAVSGPNAAPGAPISVAPSLPLGMTRTAAGN